MAGSTIRLHCRHIQQHGSPQSTAQILGRRPRRKSYSSTDLKVFIKILWTFPRLTRFQMRRYMYMATKKVFSDSTVKRMLLAVLYSYKKVNVRALESDAILVALYWRYVITIRVNHLKFVDEVHISSQNGRSMYGYSLIGNRCTVQDYFVRRHRHTVVGIVSIRGMVCHAIKPGAMNKMDYRLFILQIAIYHLVPGDYLVTDNATIHKDSIYQRILAFCGISVLFLPPYCPHFNPIELVWRGMKAMMKNMPLSVEDPVAAANIALEYYYNRDLTALFAQCGYH
eukprot:736297_1